MAWGGVVDGSLYGGVCSSCQWGFSEGQWDLSAAYVLLLMIEKLPQQLVMDR